jgi:EAL domain-containing protein (putative c-di-GMP-specific phosphodiesterase class I)
MDILYLKLSKLTYPLDDIKLKLIARMFEPVKMTANCHVFALKNGDIILSGIDMPRPKISLIIKHITSMFANDPFVMQSHGKLHVWYDRQDIKDLCEKIAKIYMEEASKNKKLTTDGKTVHEKLTSSHISSAITMLERINAAKFVRRQTAFKIEAGTSPEVAYREYFVSIVELSKSISPSIYLYSPRWLFQHFTQMLDSKMLGMLVDNVETLKTNVNININIPVIFTPSFDAFVDVMEDKQKITAEVQLKDVLRNVGEYHRAKKYLHDKNCNVAIDRIDYLALQMMDMTSLETDYIKLFWNDDILHINSDSELQRAIDRIGAEKIILAHCDSEEAVEWGKKMGITKFQGYYIDRLEGRFNASDGSGKSNKSHLR